MRYLPLPSPNTVIPSDRRNHRSQENSPPPLSRLLNLPLYLLALIFPLLIGFFFFFIGAENPQGIQGITCFLNISIDWEKEGQPLRSRFSEILSHDLTVVGLDRVCYSTTQQ